MFDTKRSVWRTFLTLVVAANLLVAISTLLGGGSTYYEIGIMSLGLSVGVVPILMAGWGHPLSRMWHVILGGIGISLLYYGVTSMYVTAIAGTPLTPSELSSTELILLLGYPYGLAMGIALCHEWHRLKP